MSNLKKLVLPTSVLLLLLGSSTSSYALTNVLYDGTQGAPADQSWLSCNDISPKASVAGCNNPSSLVRIFLGVSTNNATETRFSNSGVTLNSTSDASIYAGYSNYNFTVSLPSGVNKTLKNSAFPIIDRNTGALLNFTSQLLSETHGTTNLRSGFSVIILTNDLKGIEIGFQNNGTIFAQNATFTSTPLVSTNYDTSQLISYSLAILGNSFTLTGQPSSGGTVSNLLSGSLQTYDASQLQQYAKLVYTTPNLVFLGDDTSEASANINLTNVTLTTPYTVPWEMPGGTSFVSIGSLLILGFLRKLTKLKSQK